MEVMGAEQCPAPELGTLCIQALLYRVYKCRPKWASHGFCTARHAAAFLLARTSPGEKVVVFICFAIIEEFEPVPNAAFSPETAATWLSMLRRVPAAREGLPGPAKPI